MEPSGAGGAFPQLVSVTVRARTEMNAKDLAIGVFNDID